MLQWGRRSSSTDSSSCRAARTGSPASFNGAVDRRRRIGNCAKYLDLSGLALQWGRRSSSTDRFVAELDKLLGGRASMGPSIVVDG